MNTHTKKPKKEKKKIKRDVAKVLNKGNTKRYLMSINPYLLALADPFNIHGMKIPDMVCYPSSTFSIVDRRTLTCNAQGVAFIAYGLCPRSSSNPVGSLVPIALAEVSPLPANSKNWSDEEKREYRRSLTPLGPTRKDLKRVGRHLDLSTIDTTNSFVVGMINSSAASTSDLFSDGAGGAVRIYFSSWNATTNDIGDLYDKVRLVSAGCSANYTGVLTTATGVMTAGFAPRDSLIRYYLETNTNVSLDMIQKLPGARVLPNNDLQGATVYYRPQDNRSLEYTAESLLYDVSYGTTEVFPQEAEGGEMYIVVSGAPSGATIQITSVFNYEAIPVSSNFNLVATSPSKSDPIALSNALNTIQVAPSAIGSTSEAQGLISGKTQIQAPGSLTMSSIHNTDEGSNPKFKGDSSKSMLERIGDMALGVVEKGANSLVDKLPSILMGLF